MRDRTYRKIYQRHYGKIPVDTDGRSFQIHHIDGDHTNNDPLNLKAVTIQEHYDIHYSQDDWYACLLLAGSLKITSEEKSNLSRLAANESVKNGTHNFLGGNIQRQSQRKLVAEGKHHWQDSEEASERNLKRIEEGTHNFLDKEWAREKELEKVKNGTHPFLGGEVSRQINSKRIEEGTHNFLGGQATKNQLANGTHPSQIKKTCPHCGKTVSSGMFNRWHDDNCKNLTINGIPATILVLNK
jgi:hypothetical protein